MAKRQGKIPVATVLGLILTGKHLWAMWNHSTDPAIRQQTMLKALTGWDTPTQQFQMGEVIATYGPVVGGALVSKYVGGPKGLNINAQIRSVPLIRI